MQQVRCLLCLHCVDCAAAANSSWTLLFALQTICLKLYRLPMGSWCMYQVHPMRSGFCGICTTWRKMQEKHRRYCRRWTSGKPFPTPPVHRNRVCAVSQLFVRSIIAGQCCLRQSQTTLCGTLIKALRRCSLCHCRIQEITDNIAILRAAIVPDPRSHQISKQLSTPWGLYLGGTALAAASCGLLLYYRQNRSNNSSSSSQYWR